MKTKVLFFIGSRANISSASPILRQMNSDVDIDLRVILSNSAVLDKYGEVEYQISFLPKEIIYSVTNVVMGDIPSTMSKTFGLTAIDCSNLFEREKPDWVFIIGDRYEMLAATSTAVLMNIRVAHSMGGEVTGTIDESIRHAVTKLAHVHFAANEEAQNRIIALGEEERYVFNSGCPRIDFVANIIGKSKQKAIDILSNHDGIGLSKLQSKFVLVSQHAVTTEYENQASQINETLDALREVNLPVIMLWPNVDSGSDLISREIRKKRERGHLSAFHFISNLSAESYTILLRDCACLVGNSSSGIREAAFIGTPVVNIGSRQDGRLRGRNVIDVPNKKMEIANAIIKQVNNGKYSKSYVYGDGKASEFICEKLKSLRPKIQKKITF